MRNQKLAEIIGIVLGDGSIYTDNTHHQMRIAGHSINDKEYLIDFVKPLLENYFNFSARIKYVKNGQKEMFICLDRKEVVLKLLSAGLYSGNKLKNNQGIPSWVFEDVSFLRSCIRGLIDTDGCVCPKTPEHPSASIWFNTSIPKLKEDFSRAMELLGISISKWHIRKNTYGNLRMVTCIGKSKEALKYFEEIGFNNKYHQNRFLKSLRAPVV